MSNNYLVFDIGGTKMRLALSQDGMSLGEPKIIKTSKDFKESMALFKQAFFELSQGRPIKAAAGGVRSLDRNKKKLVANPIFPMWVDDPLFEELEKMLDAPVYLENDAAMAGLGEAVFGAGKEKSIVVYITVSTGLGGARIVNKKIDVNFWGFEPGNQIIDADGNIYDLGGMPGYLESYVSGTALEKRFNKKAYEISDSKVWEEQARLLAIGINNTIVHWSPEIVIMGGSMILGDPAISLERVSYYLREVNKVFPELPSIKKSVLGDNGGFYGALAYLWERHIK